jgi:hypothetical protein
LPFRYFDTLLPLATVFRNTATSKGRFFVAFAIVSYL